MSGLPVMTVRRFYRCDGVAATLPIRRSRSPPGRETLHGMRAIWQDVRFAGRALARQPGWTAAGVLTLAIGIAGSTLVISLLDQALVRPLRFDDGEQLVTLYLTSGPEYSTMPYPDYTEFRTELEDTVDLAAFCRVFMTVGGRAFPERHQGEMVSGGFFSVLGVQPVLGRFIGPADNVVPGVARTGPRWAARRASRHHGERLDRHSAHRARTCGGACHRLAACGT